MKKFEGFLFFYSIIAITVLFVAFGIFEPKPLNFISLSLLLPLIFYFWLRLTSPERIGADKWSGRFIASVVILSALGIGAFYLSKQYFDFKFITDKEILEMKNQNAMLSQNLATLNAQLKENGIRLPTNTGGDTVTDLILGTPQPINLNEITGKPGVKTINVYQSASTTSAKIATIDGTSNHIYVEKRGNWYRIVVTDSQAGWVSTAEVIEVQ